LDITMHKMQPAVLCAPVHLPGEDLHRIRTTEEGIDAHSLLQDPKLSLLMRYFERPRGEPFDSLTYPEYFERFTAEQPPKSPADKAKMEGSAPFKEGERLDRSPDKPHRHIVKPRAKANRRVVRVAFHPSRHGPENAIRMLLLHVPARSWSDLRKHPETGEDVDFHQACLARGLITSEDHEFEIQLQSAIYFVTGVELIHAFGVIILHAGPARAKTLWDKYEADLLYHWTRNNTHTTEQAKQIALQTLERILAEEGKTMATFNLPTPDQSLTRMSAIEKERHLDAAPEKQLQLQREANRELNAEQSQIREHICTHVENGFNNWQLFLQGPAGTGKTYLLQSISARLRLQ